MRARVDMLVYARKHTDTQHLVVFHIFVGSIQNGYLKVIKFSRVFRRYVRYEDKFQFYTHGDASISVGNYSPLVTRRITMSGDRIK